ncbi:MAG: amidohydrolase family protein, partial [Woeseiaceae bacterium]|nr:amidohydrolase family protein [Woeseiaceae bacterium]
MAAVAAQAQVTLTRGTNFSIDVAPDGRIVFDLLGEIRIIPPGGGVAQPIGQAPASAARARWSPDGAALAFQAREDGQEQLWLFRSGDAAASRLSADQFFDHHPDWHPDGERIVFSSARNETGFDLWELDVATGLTWRLSHRPGDETEPAWSANGENLVYVHHHNEEWSIVLRSRGQPERVLETSQTRLSSPSWRPDGSLLTFLRHAEDTLVTEMIILSEPLLIRPLIENEDFFVSPVAWLDRQQMLYAANGQIRRRSFNSWTSRNVPFRAEIFPTTAPRREPVLARELPTIDAPRGRLVVRSARLFDGVGGGYRDNLDIVIEDGRIVAVEENADQEGAIIIDMGDLTALPGFVDTHARLPRDATPSLGPVLLAFGLTTLVADTRQADELNALWSGSAMPGPLVLGDDWLLDLESVAAMNLSVDSLPTSPLGIRYEDARIADTSNPATVVSGLADSRTAGLGALLQSRQARLLRTYPTALRRYTEAPTLSAQSTSIVLGSAANGLPPGVGLHAELRALAGAGLDAEHVLRTAGINAAAALGLGLQLGRIAPGAVGDIVLVDGDPLAN